MALPGFVCPASCSSFSWQVVWDEVFNNLLQRIGLFLLAFDGWRELGVIAVVVMSFRQRQQTFRVFLIYHARWRNQSKSSIVTKITSNHLYFLPSASADISCLHDVQLGGSAGRFIGVRCSISGTHSVFDLPCTYTKPFLSLNLALSRTPVALTPALATDLVRCTGLM